MLNLFKKKKLKQEVEEPKSASVSDEVIITEKEIEDYKNEYKRYMFETYKFGDDLSKENDDGDRFICLNTNPYAPEQIYMFYRPHNNSIQVATFNTKAIIELLKDKKLKNPLYGTN